MSVNVPNILIQWGHIFSKNIFEVIQKIKLNTTCKILIHAISRIHGIPVHIKT